MQECNYGTSRPLLLSWHASFQAVIGAWGVNGYRQCVC